MQSKKMSLMDQVVRNRNQSQNSLYLDGAQLVECLPSMHQALSSPVLYKPHHGSLCSQGDQKFKVIVYYTTSKIQAWDIEILSKEKQD